MQLLSWPFSFTRRLTEINVWRVVEGLEGFLNPFKEKYFYFITQFINMKHKL